MKKKNKVLIAFAICLLLFLSFFFLPFSSQKKILRIPEKANATEIASLLKKEKVIKSKNLFLFLTRLTSFDKRLQYGVYEFRLSSNPFCVLKKLYRGEKSPLTVTIQEGLTSIQIGSILEKEGFCKKEDFARRVKETKTEGFLFPDTYIFPSEASLNSVIKMMVNRFSQIFSLLLKEKEEREKRLSSVNEIVTLASIIEQEALYNRERPLIASVFYNRLSKGMPLESCATIEFILPRRKKVLTEKDLRIKSPYNTYLHYGLPPSPICNPGKASLKAVLYPAKTNYLYFVSNGDGTHTFSETYQQHLAAKNNRQKN